MNKMFKSMISLILIFSVIFNDIYCLKRDTKIDVYKELDLRPELSKFKVMIDRDPVSQMYVKYRSVTVFVPTNEAIDRSLSKKFRKDFVNKLAAHHIIGVVLTKDKFPCTVSSTLFKTSPLYLSFKDSRNGLYSQYFETNSREYYVNNAKIINESLLESNFGSKQLLYIIDEVLEPYIPTNVAVVYKRKVIQRNRQANG